MHLLHTSKRFAAVHAYRFMLLVAFSYGGILLELAATLPLLNVANPVFVDVIAAIDALICLHQSIRRLR